MSGRRQSPWSIIEQGLIYLFLVVTLLLVISVPPAQAVIEETPSASETDQPFIALASAMPNQGWAPFTVYFSAFGSLVEDRTITRYEWDLDGNGSFDTDATSTRGYTSYTYSKPGLYTISLQLTDSIGNTSLDTTQINVRHPASSSVDYWQVFDDSRVGRITFTLTQANWQRMWADVEAKTQVPANVTIFGETLENVGLSFRGQFSMRESGIKKPWKIDTDAYQRDQEFYNLRQILLINAIGDESLLNEKLSYDMMRFAGVPAGHVRYVDVWYDLTDDPGGPQYLGVYTMIERVDRKFLSNRFGRESRDGNLYKASHAQRGPMDLVYYGPQISDYPTQNGMVAYGKENNEEANDYSDIIRLCWTVSGESYASEQDFANALEAQFDVDAFLRYMAVIMLTMNWDSYPYTGNNFYLFHDPLTDRFEWIPWDLTWGGDVQMPLFSRSGVPISPYAPLFDNVFSVEAYRRQVAAYLDLLLREYYAQNRLQAEVVRLHNLIAPYLVQGDGDKMFFGESAWFDQAAFENSWQNLLQTANARAAFVREQIEPYR